MKHSTVPAALCALLALSAHAAPVLEFATATDVVDMGFPYFIYNSNDAIRYGTPMNVESNVTICAWLKNPTPNPQASGYGLSLCDIAGTYYFGNSGGFGFGLSKSGSTWGYSGQTRHYGGSLNEPAPWADASSFAADGRWHHVAFVYEHGVGYRLYVDGALANEKACTGGGFTSQNNFTLGKKNWNSFLGRMAEVSLFNVAVPADRIAGFAKHRLSGDEPGLVGYWPLDEGSGTAVADHVDLDACFAGWSNTNGKAKHNGKIGASGPVWVEDGGFALPTWREWLAGLGTMIIVK